MQTRAIAVALMSLSLLTFSRPSASAATPPVRKYAFYQPPVEHVTIHEGKVAPGHYAYTYYVWPRRKELVSLAATTDAGGKKTVRRANPNARTASPRLAKTDRPDVLEFRDRASAGVDIDPVNFPAGDTMDIRFDAKVVRFQEVGMLVLCSLGDRIPIRLGVPANRPGKLYAYTRNQWEPVADFAPDEWHSVHVVVKGGEFLVTVDGFAARTYPNPIVNPSPRVYLGDGFEVDYISSNSGSEFHIALDSLVTKVARRP